jgi:hypothetical protein
MRPVVFIFLPDGEPPREIAALLQKPADADEFIPDRVPTCPQPIEDADQLALWKWFSF